VAEQALTPKNALLQLGELSAEVRASILLDPSGAVAACSDEPLGERLREPVLALLERADAAAGEPPSQVEVSMPGGAVYAAREDGWTLAVVASRRALPSLMFYDMRSVLRGLEEPPA
jgi:hypothetical protein